MNRSITPSGFERLQRLVRTGLRAAAAAAVLGCVLQARPAAANEAADPALSTPPVTAPQNSTVFLAAQNAYDEGRYEEAANLFGQLIDSGLDNMELHYNLANARFKAGNLPEAVRGYRRAWHAAPRDPDIEANLRFALSSAGAADPATSLAGRLFNLLSRGEWIAMAVGGYLALMLWLILGLLNRIQRRKLIRISLIPLLLILVSSGGWHHWNRLDTHPEWVVIHSGATALYGPMDGATAHYKVPLAALVRQRGSDPKGWVEIEYEGKRGWLRESHIKRVYP